MSKKDLGNWNLDGDKPDLDVAKQDLELFQSNWWKNNHGWKDLETTVLMPLTSILPNLNLVYQIWIWYTKFRFGRIEVKGINKL